jgi:SMODS and SLOG-associating 2TM effector domain 1
MRLVISEADATATVTYAERLRQVLAEVKPQDWQGSIAGPQITDAMERLRSSRLPERRSTYLRDRIGVQRGWYSERSDKALVSAKSWTLIGIIAGALGVVLGFLRMFTVIDVDLLGLLATVATATSAWSQFRQHRMLAASYAVADQELGAIEVTGPRIDSENEWEVFVRDAEDAISREHTLWLARRGTSPP